MMYSRRMTSKGLLISIINESNETLYRNARAIPADKLDWAPADGARTVMSMLQECVQAPGWSTAMLETRSVPGGFDEEGFAVMMAERAQWDTIDKCEAECKVRTAKLIETIGAFPEAEMDDTLFLPFTMKDHPYWDIMLYPYWNATWHTGQIAYIQVMLGDKEMH